MSNAVRIYQHRVRARGKSSASGNRGNLAFYTRKLLAAATCCGCCSCNEQPVVTPPPPPPPNIA